MLLTGTPKILPEPQCNVKDCGIAGSLPFASPLIKAWFPGGLVRVLGGQWEGHEGAFVPPLCTTLRTLPTERNHDGRKVLATSGT